MSRIRNAMRLVAAMLAALVAGIVAPWFITAAVLSIGCGLLIAGVQILAGTGWALIAGSVPTLLLGFVMLRGVARVE